MELIVVHLRGRLAMLQFLLFSMDYNLDLITSFQNFAFGQDNVSFIMRGGSKIDYAINVLCDFPFVIGLPSIVSMSHVGVFLWRIGLNVMVSFEKLS